MSGYYRYSMSNNAISAYDDGLKPFSKWSKTDILCAIKKISPETAELAIKLHLDELRKEFLKEMEWHHTSSYYNVTEFYGIDDSRVEDFNDERLEQIIKFREPKQPKSTEPPRYITAFVQYHVWSGTRKHPKKTVVYEFVKFRTGNKMVATENGSKRMSSLTILSSKEQKTKYPTTKAVISAYHSSPNCDSDILKRMYQSREHDDYSR